MMQPNDNPQYPMNYLDTIASQPQVKTMNPLLLWVMIGGILAAVIVVILLLFSVAGGSSDRLARYASQTKSLQTVATESQENIKNGELRTFNSNLALTLTNVNRDLKAPAASAGVKLEDEKLPEAAGVATETEELKKRLEDARLNAVFDRTYAREMSFYLTALRNDMNTIYDETKDEKLKTVLEAADTDFAQLQSEFSAFNEAG
jgi:hypothetical protein